MKRHTIVETVDRGICTGCGVCAVLTEGAIRLEQNQFWLYEPILEGVGDGELAKASRVCPFSDDALTEDELDAPSPQGRALPRDPRFGRLGRTFAGRVTPDDDLIGSSSGGLTTWLIRALLRRGMVDGVIHVAAMPSPGAGSHFEYVVSYGEEELATRRKSQYAPTTLARVLRQVREDGRRYAVVGVPCFVKAARLAARHDPVLGQQLTFFVGLVCGHMKSEFFGESLAWQLGVPPSELAGVDFRVKVPGRPSSRYDFAALRAGTREWVSRQASLLVGGNWGHGAMQPEACNFCDDIFAETADIVFGDAWLPRFTADWRGMNIVVTRNPLLDTIFDEGAARGEVVVEALSPDDVAASQAGNFRHRRDGLAVRLADDLDAGLSVPRKRVAPRRDHVTKRRLHLIRQRRAMSALSLRAFAEARESGDLDRYLTPMRRAIKAYAAIDTPLLRRILGRAKRVLRVVLPSR